MLGGETAFVTFLEHLKRQELVSLAATDPVMRLMTGTHSK